jgi:tetratricopeptide (TPR) repeat protein
MLLTLHPAASAQRPAAAAFLAGAGPLAWLRELSRWPLAPDTLACYVVPESVQSVRAAGLLVVFAEGALPPPDLREPYGRVAGRLYLPTHATLRPAATEAELQSQLLYAVQFFHPTIGLVGFEATDRLALADLLALPPPRPADWVRAHPGAPLPPALHSIRVQRPSVAEVLDASQAGVGTSPLTDLPNQPEPPSPLEQTLDVLKRGALRTGLAASQGLLAGLKALGGLNPGGGGFSGSSRAGAGGSAAAPDDGPSPLERLTTYLAGSLHDLDRKRNQEIERLLDLFGQDMAAALRFAIPLGGPYEHRGTAAPGSRLGPRSTSFDLGQLGGGQRADVWDTSAYESQLRTRYLQAAEQEAAAGHAQKAAYIYAHLLGDYRAAAQALAAGGYFREAAVLYQEHLRDPHTAATLLERGGLLPEALEVYQLLNAHEKVGDLYQQLGQPQRARPHYERAASTAQASGNLTLAATILAEKLDAPAQAQALLLDGWATAPNPNSQHLRHYLRLLASHAPDLPAAVRALYQQHTPARHRFLLLTGLLADLPARTTDPALQAVVQEIGFALISEDAQAGRLTSLSLLKQLLPHDRLLPGDASRYASGRGAPRR